MKTKREVQVSALEQDVLDGVKVRLIQPQEQKRFDTLIETQHYLKTATLVGERLCYVAEYQGVWLSLLAWSAPAYHLKERDAWIAWTQEQRRRRLGWVANNSRFLILEGAHYPNLASRVMGLCLGRLSADWEARWGHGLLAVESFVDGQLFRGTSYRVSGWTSAGVVVRRVVATRVAGGGVGGGAAVRPRREDLGADDRLLPAGEGLARGG